MKQLLKTSSEFLTSSVLQNLCDVSKTLPLTLMSVSNLKSHVAAPASELP